VTKIIGRDGYLELDSGMNIKPFSFSFKVEKENDIYHAWCPESGCHSHGKTKLLALENLKDTVQLYLDTLMEEEIARLVIEECEGEQMTMTFAANEMVHQ